MNFQDESQYYFDSCTSLNKGDSPEIIFEFMHNSSIGVALNHVEIKLRRCMMRFIKIIVPSINVEWSYISCKSVNGSFTEFRFSLSLILEEFSS